LSDGRVERSLAGFDSRLPRSLTKPGGSRCRGEKSAILPSGGHFSQVSADWGVAASLWDFRIRNELTENGKQRTFKAIFTN
jgi:hypothetical protein